MKKYLFIIAAAATCLLVACSKEKELRAPETNTEETTASEFVRLPGWTYVGASNLEDSKASITNDATPVFKWNAGDKIALFTDNNDYLVSAGLDNSFDNATEAEFAFEGTGIDAHRAFFAVYPASLVSGCANPTANSLAINLPASYTLAQVQGEVSPIPMVAANAPGDPLAFKSICALLRITVKNIAKDAQSIKVRFPGQKVNGAFALADFVAGTSGVAGAASSSEAEETITITNLGISAFVDQLVINVPVPMGTFDDVIVSACDGSGLFINRITTPVKVVSDVPTTWSPGRKSRRTVSADLPVFTVYGATLSAADKRMIVFAPGNLQARLDEVPQVTLDKYGAATNSCSIDNFGTADKWRFAEHQYESFNNYIPASRTHSLNSLVESERGDYTDLFAWTGNDITNSTMIAKDAAYKYGIFYGMTSGASAYLGNGNGATLAYDWGTNVIDYGGSSYAANTWRTPTNSEWQFVFTNRMLQVGSGTQRIPQGAKAKIVTNGADPQPVAYGMIILPDNYSHPYALRDHQLTKVYQQSNKSYDSNTGGSVCSDNVYTVDEWEKLEGAGCVFLPLTNMRCWNSDAKCALTRSDGVGIYWSSTHKGTSVCYALAFNSIEAGAVNAYTGLNTAETNNGDSPRDNVTFGYNRNRYYCIGVRLVRDVN